MALVFLISVFELKNNNSFYIILNNNKKREKYITTFNLCKKNNVFTILFRNFNIINLYKTMDSEMWLFYFLRLNDIN